MKQRITNKEVVQKRALETQEKLFISALKMYAEKGFHATTVDEIAKNAGLSVGIAYRYFKNKKELLIGAISYGFKNVSKLTDTKSTDIFGKDLDKALTAFEKLHVEYFGIHEELEALRHSDEDVWALYDVFTKEAYDEIHKNLPDKIRNSPHSLENLYIAIGMLENYCHHFMHKDLSDDELCFMKKRVIEMTELLLKA